MKATMRRYRSEEDYWRIRAFLREVMQRNGQRDWSWPVARLDYWRWHLIENCKACHPVEDVTFIWETPEGHIAAVLNPEDRGEVYLQVHPLWRTPGLEEEMIVTAEERLPFVGADGRRTLCLWAHRHDELRREILARRGYAPGQGPAYQRRRLLDGSIPPTPPTAGYTVRALGAMEELPARSWASWRAFHPDEPDEKYQGWEWYHNIQRMPLYRRDLDIVAAVAPHTTGSRETSPAQIVAFCTIWYDDVTRTGCFEPVGVVPEHQRRGLGTAVMIEGLRRLKRLGATVGFVTGFSPAANALYASVMSPEYELVEPWRRRW
jgi:mycothiol synthase